MSKRLQVLMNERELRAARKLARQRRVTLSDLVRTAVRDELRRAPVNDQGKKLAAIREAARHAFPAGDLDQMLEEIERGYGSPDAR